MSVMKDGTIEIVLATDEDAEEVIHVLTSMQLKCKRIGCLLQVKEDALPVLDVLRSVVVPPSGRVRPRRE